MVAWPGPVVAGSAPAPQTGTITGMNRYDAPGATTVNKNPPPGMTIPACAPTDDPAWWRMVDDCDETCHHPLHGFGDRGRRPHLIPAEDAVLFEHEPSNAERAERESAAGRRP